MPHCIKCDKLIAKEEFETFSGMCHDCYEEEQQISEDDLDSENED